MNSECCIAGILSNVSASTSVLAATMATLSTTTERNECEDATVAYLASADSSVTLENLPNCPKQGTSAAVCHCSAMDARQGLWTLASARENGKSVLMAIKGTLSKETMLLERMCIYRMVIPAAFADALTTGVRRMLLPPKFPRHKVDSLQKSIEEMKVPVLCLTVRAVWCTSRHVSSFTRALQRAALAAPWRPNNAVHAPQSNLCASQASVAPPFVARHAATTAEACTGQGFEKTRPVFAPFARTHLYWAFAKAHFGSACRKQRSHRHCTCRRLRAHVPRRRVGPFL